MEHSGCCFSIIRGDVWLRGYAATGAHIPLEFASASANFRVANAENDAQTT